MEPMLWMIQNTTTILIVRWVGNPYQAQKDEAIRVDGEEFVVEEGEWLCNGKWLDRLQGTKKWWYQTDRRCIVQL